MSRSASPARTLCVFRRISWRAGIAASQFALDQVYQIEVYGGAGHDMLDASGLSTPVMIDGGEGGDLIWGGRGDDLLVRRLGP